jgi:alpha-tubulin suppressor-like RCC1 family protein
VQVAGRTVHALAVRSDGTVWAWGLNEDGELGDGTTTDRNTPVQVAGLTGSPR